MKNRTLALIVGLILLGLQVPRDSQQCDCSALCCQSSCSLERQVLNQASGEEFCGAGTPPADKLTPCCRSCENGNKLFQIR